MREKSQSSLIRIFKFPLHMHIATMFIVLTIILGLVQIWFNYQKNTELIKESSIIQYEKVMERASMDLKSKYDMAANSVGIISQGGLPKAKTLDQRLQYLPVISTVLANNDAVSGFEVGYINGDFFIVRSTATQYMREQFKAPAGTFFMVDNIQAPSIDPQGNIRIYYDQFLREIARSSLGEMQYDPRVRPWYKLALESDGYATTSPYLYYFVKKIGLTITLESEEKGTVVAADIELDDISSILKNNIISPSSELILFATNGKVIAYKDPEKLIIEDDKGNNSIAGIEELQSKVLKENSSVIGPKEKEISFYFKNERWGGVIKKFEIHKDFKLFFAFVAPDKELFAKAVEIRWQSSFIALVLILIAVPITGYSAYLISKPIRKLTIETQKIRQFDFSSQEMGSSIISEISALNHDMIEMKATIGHFLTMINTLAGEKNLDSLLATITQQTLEVSKADAVVLFLLNEEGTVIEPASVKMDEQVGDIVLASHKVTNDKNFIIQSIKQHSPKVHMFKKRADGNRDALAPFFEKLATDTLQVLTLPLNNRSGDVQGILCVINDYTNEDTEDLNNQDRIGFMQTLSGFAAVSMESRHLLKTQEELLASIIQLIAGAIDAKSRYTAGHCQRVPEITSMLAREACKQQTGEFKDYSLSKEEWDELDIAAWLHDCGKITTPEYVVDKSTKLETISDRIHEIRMRFEVLKRDVELEYWQKMAAGKEDVVLREKMVNRLTELDDDFAFVAKCNIGSEFMSNEDQHRIKKLANIQWRRTLNDRLGISWEEAERKERSAQVELPVMEQLFADKPEHIIKRDPKDVLAPNNKWGFNMQTPEHLYNRGELYNLCITKGTLNEEERYKVNEHMIQGIMMLESLKFPKALSNVVEIAGGHHEKMDGTGFPKRLTRENMSVSARMVAIADIFEALTAADRPYKKAKKLSEAIKIMSFMKKGNHIDGALFDLFLRSGVYLEYAQKYLAADQIDKVDIDLYLTV
ncbi:HD domain-containing phosphohydrolase [Gammaproteobacteria bacterium AS21]